MANNIDLLLLRPAAIPGAKANGKAKGKATPTAATADEDEMYRYDPNRASSLWAQRASQVLSGLDSQRRLAPVPAPVTPAPAPPPPPPQAIRILLIRQTAGLNQPEFPWRLWGLFLQPPYPSPGISYSLTPPEWILQLRVPYDVVELDENQSIRHGYSAF